jgi:acetolactate synthase I/II/III large subunit
MVAYSARVDQQTVAQLVLKYLALEGATTLFGVPGAAVMHLLDELKLQRDTFRYIVCRQETGAAYIADGYSRATGKLGVVVVTSGPGATNALTGTMNAQCGGTSLLTISGEIPEQYFGMGYLQEGVDTDLDVNAVYAAASRYSTLVTSASNFQTLFTQALRDALSRPRQAVHVSLPDDVAASVVPSVQFPTSPANYRALPEGAPAGLVAQSFQHLVAAERPLIFVGNGTREALRGGRLLRFERFVEKFAIPVMTTPDGKAIFPERHALSLRNYGIAGCEWPKYWLNPSLMDPKLPAKYDALLVLATTMGELSTNKWDPLLVPNGPFIQVDLDQSVVARAMPIELGVVAEVGAFIDQMCALGEAAQPDEKAVAARRAFVAEIKRKHSPFADPAKRDSEAKPILPQALMKCVNEALPRDAMVFVDAGNCVGWTCNDLELDPPAEIHMSLGMGPMGFGVGAAIGAKLGAPERACVAVVGDGAFLMHGNEVSTAARHRIGAVFVVLDDDNLLMVNQGMNQFFPDPKVWREYYDIGRPKLAELAHALGADGYEVHSPAEMRRVFPEALAKAAREKKPQVIAARINIDEIPPYYPKKP